MLSVPLYVTAAAAALPVVVQRQGEALVIRDRRPLVLEAGQALAHRPGKVQRVADPVDDVEVVARPLRVDDPFAAPAGAGEEVACGVLQVGPEIGAVDLHGPEEVVVVGVEPGQVRHPDLALGDPGLEVEGGHGRELGAGGLALHVAHPAEERGVLHPGQRPRPRGGTGGEHPGDPGQGPVVGGGQRRLHGRVRRGAGLRAEDPSFAPDDVPPPVVAGSHGELHDGEGPGMGAGLGEADAVKERVGDLLVGMPHEDGVDPGDLAGDVGHLVLGPEAGGLRVVARPLEAGVGGHDDQVGAGLLQFRDDGAKPVQHGGKGEPPLHVVPVPDGDARRKGPGDPHPEGNAVHRQLHHRAPGPDRLAGGRVHDVGGEEGEPGIGEDPVKVLDPEVELVVSQRRSVVAQEVHGLDHRVHLALGEGGEGRRHGASLQEVARVHEHDPPGVRVPDGVHERGEEGEAPVHGLSGRVVPGEEPAMHIGGSDDDDARRVGPCLGPGCRRGCTFASRKEGNRERQDPEKGSETAKRGRGSGHEASPGVGHCAGPGTSHPGGGPVLARASRLSRASSRSSASPSPRCSLRISRYRGRFR